MRFLVTSVTDLERLRRLVATGDLELLVLLAVRAVITYFGWIGNTVTTLPRYHAYTASFTNPWAWTRLVLSALFSRRLPCFGLDFRRSEQRGDLGMQVQIRGLHSTDRPSESGVLINRPHRNCASSSVGLARTSHCRAIVRLGNAETAVDQWSGCNGVHDGLCRRAFSFKAFSFILHGCTNLPIHTEGH